MIRGLERPEASGPLLALRGLTKTFGGLVAVDGVDLDVAPGEIHGLIGPNGSGKSTTLNLISGVYRPSRGQVLWEGRDIARTAAPFRTALGIARTFQNIRLFPRMTVLDNVAVGQYCRTGSGLLAVALRLPRERAEERAVLERAREALELTGVAGRAHQYPTDLPYGIQRLVEIARSLATAPRLLLLDEPAAGMNPAEKQQLLHLVRRLRSELGLTMVLVEHDMSFIMRLCDRITVLNFGARIAQGTPGQVRRDPAVVEAYLGKGGGMHAG